MTLAAALLGNTAALRRVFREALASAKKVWTIQIAALHNDETSPESLKP